MRRILVAVLSGVAIVASPAAGAAKPELAITQLKPHFGARIGPGERFLITGVVRNRGRRASRALIGASLRSGRQQAYTLGAVMIRRVKGGRRRSFTVHAVGPRLPAGSAAKRFALVACARPRRGARPACRRASRSALVVPGSGLDSTGGNQAPATGSPDTATPAPGDGTAFTPGARSAGDRLFPEIGNGGYDATHYDLAVSYDPATKALQGTATIDATALQNLSEYSLDLYAMTVSSVLVDGAQAAFKQEPGKLIVTPPAGVPSAAGFTTTVTYAKGTIAAYTDPDGSHEGWVPSSDGAFVVNEPVGAMSWFPNDNVPTDKATYDLHVTVPGSSKVIGNGRLVSSTASPDGTGTWHWREDSPMASYLVTATNGAFDLTTDTTTNPQIPAWYGLDSSYTAAQKTAMQSRLNQTPSILTFYADFLTTPYPFSSAGGVIDESSVGYSLETQSKPMYAVNNGVDPASPLVDTIAHELAHQWFGDSVSPATWSDIWLNEGPAEFFSWLWLERTNNNPLTTQQRFDANYANPAMRWNIPPAAPPTAADIFDGDAMYTRGAMVMEALREIMGEPTFKTVLATYLAQHKYGNASTQQFIDLVKRDSGKDPKQLDIFFQEWLYGTEKPGITPANFDTYTPPS
jgi:aminopeptidase N